MRGSLLAVAGLSALAAVAVSADEELANFPHLTVDRAARCYARTQPAAGYGSDGRTIVYEAAAARRAVLRAFATGSPAWATSVLPDGEVRIRVMPPARDFDSTGDTVLHTFAWYAQELWLRCDEIGTPDPTVVQAGPWPRGSRATHDHLAVAFHHGGRLVQRYSTLDIAGSPDRVSATISHYSVVTHHEGFRTSGTPASLQFGLVTHDGRHLTFDAITGAIVETTAR